MLSTLSIKNYALIDELHVDFSKGFSIITGETGAGKSILLGALGLVLGKRADSTYLNDSSNKCIVEAQFAIDNYDLKSFFEEHDLDFEAETIIRRELLASGKSRAFINDTPTTLSVLNALSEKLIDVHSQHQTLALSDVNFQFQILDALASNKELIASYQQNRVAYNALQKELEAILKEQAQHKLQHDYNLHLFNELDALALVEGEQESLEQELDKLNNAEHIKLSLSEAVELVDNEELGILNSLNSLKSKLQQIASYSETYEQLYERITSTEIELKDVLLELENANEHIQHNPSEIERLNDRLQLIYDILKKHSVNSISEVLEIHATLSDKIYYVEHASETIQAKEHEILELEKKLNALASTIHKNRTKVIPQFLDQLHNSLANLGMANARFQFNLTQSDKFYTSGKDELEVLFSANKGSNFGELKKVASGGELSRIMLSVKAILSSYTNLPTIIFDEIDTGVSGEISNKMGDIMQQMSKNMQVVSITHLPQIAAKGDQHFKVFKEEIDQKISTKLVQLSADERIVEIAEMLGGKELSESAVNHAKELLN